MNLDMISIKCVLVGDVDVGKTELITSYTSTIHPKESVVRLMDIHSITISKDMDAKPINLLLWNSQGQEQYSGLRPLLYENTDVFILTFSLLNSTSFQNIKHKWFPELLKYCPNTPIMLVGTDVNSSYKSSTKISTSQGAALAKEIGARKYVECSTMGGQGLQTVFDEVIREGLLSRNKKEPGFFTSLYSIVNR